MRLLSWEERIVVAGRPMHPIALPVFHRVVRAGPHFCERHGGTRGARTVARSCWVKPQAVIEIVVTRPRGVFCITAVDDFGNIRAVRGNRRGAIHTSHTLMIGGILEASPNSLADTAVAVASTVPIVRRLWQLCRLGWQKQST